MNPVLIFLICIAAFLFWALCVYIFYPLGCLIFRWIDKFNEVTNKEDLNEKEKKDIEER